MVTRATARNILSTYGKAWEDQDTNLILSIFAKNATYQERTFSKPFKGHKGIASYWNEKVVKEQSKIKFKLLNYWVFGNVIVAEWEAWFYTNVEKANKHMREVAIMETKAGKITHNREYWHSKTTKSRKSL